MKSVVLAIDPAPATHRFLRTFLADEPIEIVEASDGATAKTLLDQRRIDLVLTALKLTDTSGFSICEHVRQNPCTASVPVIILAEGVTRVERVRGLQVGATDYITKPIDPSELQARVRAALRSREMQRELEQQNSLLYQLHEFSLKLNTMETPEETMRASLICALSLTYSRCGCILTPDANGSLRVAHIEGADRQAAADFAMPVGDPVSGQVLAASGLRVVNRADDVPNGNAPDLALLGGPPFACLCVPSNKGSVGVLAVAGKLTGDVYSDQDLRILRCVVTTAGVAIESQRRRLRLDRTRDAALLGLAGLAEWRDPETGSHLERLRGYAHLLAEGLRQTPKYARIIDQGYLDALLRAVPMHDIGKVGVPDQVLLKPGKLTDEEFTIIKRHTEVGAKVLRSMTEKTGHDSFLVMACDIALYHHEKFDGSGYPTGLAGEAIPLAARITAVADVYDALVTDRVYRKAWPHEKAVSYIQENSGSHFDPEVVQIFRQRDAEFLELKTRLEASDARREAASEAVPVAPPAEATAAAPA